MIRAPEKRLVQRHSLKGRLCAVRTNLNSCCPRNGSFAAFILQRKGDIRQAVRIRVIDNLRLYTLILADGCLWRKDTVFKKW